MAIGVEKTVILHAFSSKMTRCPRHAGRPGRTNVSLMQSAGARALLSVAAVLLTAIPAFAQGGYGGNLGFGGNAPWRSGRGSTIPFFTPPAPPRLDATIPEPPEDPVRSREAPDTMSDFPYAAFYSPLAARLRAGSLTDRQDEQLQDYLIEKLTLQNELRAKLDSLASDDLLVRATALAEFSRQQTPRILALEEHAEEMREDFINGVYIGDFLEGILMQPSVNWANYRSWRLGRDVFQSSDDAIDAQYQALMGASFFQPGLAPFQRRLLREVATDLREAQQGAVPVQVGSEEALESDVNPLFSFTPETARIRLPANLPTTIMNKITRYEQEKSALKEELGRAVIDSDDSLFSFMRTRGLRQLGELQAPKYDELEVLAEDIRRDLAGMPEIFTPPTLPALPPGVASRIQSVVAVNRERQERLYQLLAQLSEFVTIGGANYIRDANGREMLQLNLPQEGQNPEVVARANQLRDEFNLAASERAEQTNRDMAAIRAALASMFSDPPGPELDRRIDEFLLEYSDAIEQRDRWFLYTDYRTAMLQPGLSPEQRRLLFDAALVELDLPLPERSRTPRVTTLATGE